jgi:hypothetical protein
VKQQEHVACASFPVFKKHTFLITKKIISSITFDKGLFTHEEKYGMNHGPTNVH